MISALPSVAHGSRCEVRAPYRNYYPLSALWRVGAAVCGDDMGLAWPEARWQTLVSGDMRAVRAEYDGEFFYAS